MDLDLQDQHVRSLKQTLRFRTLGTTAFGILCAALALLGQSELWTAAALCGAWLIINLGLSSAYPELRRRGLVLPSLLISQCFDILAVLTVSWAAGGAEWLGLAALFPTLTVTALVFRPGLARRVFALAFGAYLVYLWLAFSGQVPAQGVFSPLNMGEGSLQRSSNALACLSLLALFNYFLLKLSSSLFEREKNSHASADRLRSANQELSDQYFSMQMSQQDLLMANDRLRQKSLEVLKSQDVIRTLTMAVESKDAYTEGHSLRVAGYAVALAREIGLPHKQIEALKNGCVLHDIGKINLSDLILRKPGQLSPDEYELVKRHPVIGEQICQPLDWAREFLDVVRHHHERWDGRGYPDGLQGKEISLNARIAAIADAFDAMTSDRPYRAALPVDIALGRLRELAGVQWDPELVNFFGAMMERRMAESEGRPLVVFANEL